NSLTVSGSSNNQTLVPDANIVLGMVDATHRNVTVTPAAGQSGGATITISVSDGSLSAQDTFLLTGNSPGNTPPTISDVTDQTITQDTNTGALNFTVNDAETAPSALTVTASSNNQTLVPDANIALGGSDTDRTITVTPASGQTGLAIITI